MESETPRTYHTQLPISPQTSTPIVTICRPPVAKTHRGMALVAKVSKFHSRMLQLSQWTYKPQVPINPRTSTPTVRICRAPVAKPYRVLVAKISKFHSQLLQLNPSFSRINLRAHLPQDHWLLPGDLVEGKLPKMCLRMRRIPTPFVIFVSRDRILKSLVQMSNVSVGCVPYV